jgi:hypothetical protein
MHPTRAHTRAAFVDVIAFPPSELPVSRLPLSCHDARLFAGAGVCCDSIATTTYGNLAIARTGLQYLRIVKYPDTYVS